MRRNRTSKIFLAASTGLLAAAVAWAAPGRAGPIDDSFLSALGGSGIDVSNPASVTALGQSVCPMLTEPAGSVASVMSSLTGGNRGMSPEMARLFTQIAVQAYCPQMLAQLSQGQLPEIPGMAGGLPGLSGIPGL